MVKNAGVLISSWIPHKGLMPRARKCVRSSRAWLRCRSGGSDSGQGRPWTSMMREVIFDTETTGLDPQKGDRLIEIGCIELVNRFPTGQVFHRYINPERDVPSEAFAIHGLSGEFLKDK